MDRIRNIKSEDQRQLDLKAIEIISNITFLGGLMKWYEKSAHVFICRINHGRPPYHVAEKR
jgi:hypothetical protein